MKCDIVYILKDTITNPELKYSLRSIHENFPGHRVVFVGGHPKGLKPDIQIKTKQYKTRKWDNAKINILSACKDKRLTEEIYLFNDDFFILKPIGEIPVFSNGNLKEFMDMILSYGGKSEYVEDRIKPIYKLLIREKLPTINYELHVPMKINRKKVIKVLERYPKATATRSLYGNYYRIKTIQIDTTGKMRDGQQQNPESRIWKSRTFISTTDESFAGKLGKQIKEMFSHPSPWEK